MSSQFELDQGFEEFLNDDYWMQPHDWALPLAQTLEMNLDTAASQQSIELETEDLSLSIAGDFSYKPRFAYLKETCASCHEPLDLVQRLANFENPSLECPKSRGPKHATFVCDLSDCDKTFAYMKDLMKHSRDSWHRSFWCTAEGCKLRLSSGRKLVDEHFAEQHPDLGFTCAQCHAKFSKVFLLNTHGREEGHDAYVCQFPGCESKAAQMGELNRHQLSHAMNVRTFPCSYCRKYRGSNGFKRKDHLRQHIRNYHHIEEETQKASERFFFCPMPACLWFRSGSDLGLLEEQVTVHMLTVHHSKPFPCNKPLCDRIAMNGFDTEEAFKSHLKKDHLPGFQCSHPGCDRVGMKGYSAKWAFGKHMKNAHGSSLDSA